MLGRIKTSQITTDEPLLSRRAAVLGLGGVAAAGVAGCGTTEPQRKSMNLDFSKPEDNLTAWVKLASSLEDGVETCGHFAGIQYGDIGPQEVIQPLFRISGFGMSRITKLEDGRYENLHKEVVYYMPLDEDRIMETWDNPYTGETVEVFMTHNDPVNSYYAPTFKQKFGTEEDGFEVVEFPFVLPWDIFGDRAVCAFSVNTRWPSPLPPEKWPREHFGQYYRTSEYFQIHSNLTELNDPDIPKAHYTGAWQKVAPWNPWMAMAGTPGGILGISNVFSLDSVEELPRVILDYTEKHFPEYLTAPTKWVEPNMTTWETYAAERTPLPAK